MGTRCMPSLKCHPRELQDVSGAAWQMAGSCSPGRGFEVGEFDVGRIVGVL